MKLAITNSSINPINHYITDAIVRAARDHKEIEKVISAAPYNLARMVKDNPGFVVLVADGQGANTNQISQAIRYSCRSAVWFFEDPYEIDNNIIRSSMFDLSFTTDEHSIHRYNSAEYLPLAADPEVCYFPVRAQWEFDISFVGVAWPNRVEELLALKAQFSGLRWNVRLITNGSIQPFLTREGLVDKIHNAGWVLSPDTIGIRDLAALSNRSRITLGLPRKFSLDPKQPLASSNSPAPRIFEVAMAGGAQIVSDQSVSGKTYPFSAGTLFTYGALGSLAEQVEHLLSHDKLVYEAAHLAQSECLSKHTYSHRVSQIVEKLADEAGNFPKVGTSSRNIIKHKWPESILIIAHARVGAKYFGGVEVFSSELMSQLPIKRKFLAAPAADESGHYLITDNEGLVVANLPMSSERGMTYCQDARVESWLEEFVMQNRIENVFFCHLINWPLSIVPRLATLGLNTILKLNEYFYLCPSLNLQSFSNVYCNMPRLGTRACDSCLYQMTGAEYGTFHQRLNIMGEILSNVDTLIAPSTSTKVIYETVFPDLCGKISVMPYFLPRRAPRTGNRGGAKLKVLVAGVISRHKGGFDICAIMDQLVDDDIEFHICGDCTREIEMALAPLLALRRNITMHGPYSPSELPEPFYECDVALFLSTWPETYLITLTEAMRTGCVPIVTSIGAHGDRIVHGENGFKVDVGDWIAVVDILHGLLIDRAPLAEMRHRSALSPATSVEDYVSFLNTYLAAEPAVRSRSAGIRVDILANTDLGIFMPEITKPPPVETRNAAIYARILWTIYKSQGAFAVVEKMASYVSSKVKKFLFRG
ncbi:glycosyltransferase [Rhizobium sp. RAF56]|uniref:glycosyltransferase n=1 Tax=Rhizobium sp. RAF56 TaxID=3233062 RepID=UPI003F94799C